MPIYDLHTHTTLSACSWIKPKTLLKQAEKKNLDGLAVTDHGTIEGALKVKKMNKNKSLQIITGAEIKTELCEVLALGINEEIRSHELEEVLDQIRSQGGISAIAHPFRVTPWQSFHGNLSNYKKKIDCLETFNSRNILWSNKIAQKKADKFGFAHIGGSDAHLPIDIGMAYTYISGDDIFKAIRKKETKSMGKNYYAVVSGISSAIKKRILEPMIKWN